MLQGVAAAVLLASASAQATTIDFDQATVSSELNYIFWLGGYYGYNYQEEGFKLQSGNTLFNGLGALNGTLNAGSYSMANTLGTEVTLTSTTGPAFGITTMDVRNAITLHRGHTYDITFTGITTAAQTVTQTFTFSDTNWHQVVFGSDFSSLTSLSWSKTGYVYDNINVTAVPEPATYAMLMAGLGLVGLARRRKQA
jgi:opacity protein-like surface antigen